MVLVRYLIPALVGGLFWVVPLDAQQNTGTIAGRVIDGGSQQPIANATVLIEGTQRTTLTRTDGGFELTGVPTGAHRLRVARIGYAPQLQGVTVAAGATVSVQFALQQHIAVLEEVVVTGYGTQRREAITGSVASINPEAANVGVVPNVTDMIQGRAAGLNIVTNNGEPGANSQIRIRGGTSISASNEPLYVIDGVPINNVATEPEGIGIGGSPSLSRNPLNMLNPADIGSITILKDASATAIYGARAANGVVLIETKRGAAGAATMEYDAYVAMATPARYLDVLNGAEYRQFIQDQVAAGVLNPVRLNTLGSANTDWERAVTRTAATTNHNVSFAGGTDQTRYRASLNYLSQQGVVLGSGFQRYQGRLNASHQALNDRLRLSINLTASHVANDYLPYETEGGFEGGVFQNVAVFNPTQPVRVTDAAGREVFYEIGPGRQSVRNPVALTEQIEDFGKTTRALGNVTTELELVPGLTAQFNVGADRSDATRRTYFPRESAVGAEWQGRARQVNRDNTSVTLQSLLTLQQQFGDNGLDVVGGYEFNEYTTGEFGAEARNFLTDAFSFNNLAGGNDLVKPFSWREDSRLVSFFGRANYSLHDRYFLTGVLRYDGSTRFGAGNKWALFPALSASWRVSEEAFFGEGLISDLRLRAGWGLQGNPAVPPYASLILLEPRGDARYAFGDQQTTGVAPVRNPNPDLKWEETEQINVALDYGLLDDRLTGSIEYYVKNTRDLILDVPVPQPAAVGTRLENIGRIRNRGLELSLDAQVLSRSNMTLLAGLVFASERNEVVDLGGRLFIPTAFVSGQGQSGQVAQRILPGHPLGTFFGPEFVGVEQGRQLFNQYQVERDAEGREISRELVGTTTTPGGDDFVVIGDANPDFALGLRSRGTIGNFDFSFLIRSEVGQDVFNNTALVYSTKSNALQDKNFLQSALADPDSINEPAKYSSRWIEDGSYARLQNLTVGYTFDLPAFVGQARTTRIYVSGDNLLLLTGYSGLDPEAHSQLPGLAVRGVDYLNYPRPRTFTAGLRVTF